MPIDNLKTKADLENFIRSMLDGMSADIETLKGYAKHEHFGTGSPEGVVEAPVGDRYRRIDGGAATSLYVKESGSGDTGWDPK